MSSLSSEHSRISPLEACSAQDEFAQLAYSQTGSLGWLERSGRTNQITQLVCQTETGFRRLSAPNVNVGSRVHEYGGRAWCWGDEYAYYIGLSDQQIYRVDLQNLEIKQLTFDTAHRFLEPVWHRPSNSLLLVWELHSETGVENRIGLLEIASGQLKTLAAGADFYAGLSLDSQHERLSWVSWNHPDQPWTNTQIYCAQIGNQGLSEVWQVPHGLDDGDSMAMPQFTATGDLLFISDRSGYWSPYRAGRTLSECTALNRTDIDQISAPWQSGQTQYLSLPNGELVSLFFSSTGVTLSVASEAINLPGLNHIRELAHFNNCLSLIVAGPTEPLQIVQFALHERSSNLTRIATPSVSDRPVSLPQLIEFSAGDMKVHGYYYPPFPGYNQPAPLIITLHGGPTSSTYPILNTATQFWCSQGFGLFDLNYRGSSNSGRVYREALKYHWGVSEIEDIAEAIEQLKQLGLVRSDAIFIRGRSSGGYSALLAAAQIDDIRAATSYFGVMEPERLKASTHKFESHYLDWLLPQQPGYDTPLALASQINTPILFLQGMQDKVVTPDQTQLMIEALNKRKIPVEVRYFAAEGHGFRAIETQVEALETELKFYRGLTR